MSNARYTVMLVAGMLSLGLACEKEQPPVAAPPPSKPAPAPPPAPAAAAPDAAAAKPKMVANPDGLSLAERIAKRQAEEKKVADQLAGEEKQRLLKYDKTKLPLHTQVFAFIKKTRGQYDALEKKIAGASDKAKGKEDIEKLAGSLRAPIEATGKKMATIDPKGGNSNVTTDYDVMLNALANDYPEAMVASLDGDPKPLEQQKAELDKRTKKVEDWLGEVKKAKK
jgi:hypothetical protein